MSTENIEEIKSKLDIVEIIQEYIQLKPAGTNSFKANCPFHNEKTPSFVVSRDKEIWHCFGCGEGGDMFSFVMRMEGMEFPEALRVLAKKAGVQLRYQDPTLQNQKTTLLDICRTAATFYHALLTDHPKAQFVRDYVNKRGLGAETLDQWQVGFAPDAGETLVTYLVKQKFSEEDIFQAGLTVKRDRGVGYFDRFRNRLMFPIWDTHGNVVGFGGRWLGQEENVAKYINTPQTLIYNKSHVLYGIDKAKQAIRTEKLAVVVEGYMDCITSHQAGVTNVVASSGTALTADQVRLLKRYSTNVAFAFDHDIAGDTASRRGIEVAWQEDMNTKIILIPGAKDPDELIRKDVTAWKKAIADAQSIMEYYFQSALAQSDVSAVEGKKQAAKTLLPVIARLADPIEQTHYLQKLAQLLKVGEDVLRDKLRQVTAGIRPSEKASPTQAKAATAVVRDRFMVLGERLVGIALSDELQLNYLSAHLLPEDLPPGTVQQLYKSLISYYTEKHTFDYQDFLHQLAGEGANLSTYAEVLSLAGGQARSELTQEMLEQEVVDGVRQLKKHAIELQLKEVEACIRESEAAGETAKLEQYSQQFSELTARLQQVS